jgi:hypothetical protein
MVDGPVPAIGDTVRIRYHRGSVAKYPEEITTGVITGMWTEHNPEYPFRVDYVRYDGAQERSSCRWNAETGEMETRAY